VARVLLDTNVYIIGYRRRLGDEWDVLEAVRKRGDIVLLSHEMQDQVRRVGRRVGGKDYAGLILSIIWRDLMVDYVILPADPFALVAKIAADVPPEDALVFLAAHLGRADCLVSTNRQFLQESAAAQDLFLCLSPAEFLAAYPIPD